MGFFLILGNFLWGFQWGILGNFGGDFNGDFLDFFLGNFFWEFSGGRSSAGRENGAGIPQGDQELPQGPLGAAG